MKLSIYVGMAVLTLAALVVVAMVYADCETTNAVCPCPCTNHVGSVIMKDAKIGDQNTTAVCPCPYHSGSAVMKDAKFAVQNTADGVTITVTATNAEQVKAIQAAFTNFGKGTNAPCAMMNPTACQKAHAAGSCAGHATSGITEDHHKTTEQK